MKAGKHYTENGDWASWAEDFIQKRRQRKAQRLHTGSFLTAGAKKETVEKGAFLTSSKNADQLNRKQNYLLAGNSARFVPKVFV